MWICVVCCGQAARTKSVFYKFNGRSPRRTLAYKGRCFTTTFYRHRSCGRLPPSVRAKLHRLGAKAPAKREAHTLRRRSLTEEAGNRAARTTEAGREGLRFTGVPKSRSAPGRKLGECARHSWVCGWCGKRGAQSWGAPRQWCSNAGKMRSLLAAV